MSAVPVARGRLRQIGKYTLGRRIGAGGMAAVFAAREEGPVGLGRLCAFKVMSSALVGDPAHERLFLREAGITARLDHPNIVRVHEVGEADSTLYIAMEFVHGVSLRDLCMLTPERLPGAMAVAIVIDVARALHATHELSDAEGRALNIVHQDVSPHNVMVTYEGVTKLLDFGVARIGAFDASRTATVRGKPSYLAPEQLLGERVDRRSDVFALGGILYELLTGHQPFHRRTELETFAAITESRLGPIADRAPAVPAAVVDVCEQALEREPAQRFATAAAFADALESACRDGGIERMAAADIGNIARAIVPPSFTPRDLEREIVGGQDPLAAADVADLATVSLLHSGPAVVRARARWPLYVTLALVACVGALLWLRSGSEAARLGTPSVFIAPPGERRKPAAEEPAPVPLEPSTPAVTSSRVVPRGTVMPSASASTSEPPAARIAVRSTPWGTVLLDGVPVGDSPKVLTTTAGSHTISVRTKDGRTQSRSVQAKPDATVLVQIVF